MGKVSVLRACTLAAALAAIAAPAPALAATATSNLSVTATVINNCTISTAALAFGNYDPVNVNAAAPLDGTGTVTIACTKGTSATIGLGLGANPSGTTRRMTDGSGNFLVYEVFHEVAHTTVWGTAGAALLSPAAAPSKAARNFTVYGSVTSNQDVSAGNYSDTVVATVNF